MKKKIFSIIIVVSLGLFTVNAQNTGEIQYGIGGGINFSNITINEDDVKTESLSSFNAHLSAEYYFDDRLGVKSKIIYDNKGWAQDVVDPNSILETLKSNYSLKYITIPLMVNYHFGSIQSRAKSFATRPWYLSFGPYIGFLTKAEESLSGNDFKESLKSIDYGAAFNFGLRFEITDFTKLYIEYDGQYGLADIAADSKTTAQNSSTTIKNGLRSSVNLGLLFAFY